MERTPSETAGTLPSDIAALSFEQALAELEAIVRELESGKGALEASVTAYQRGAALKRHCEAKLAEAEQKIQAIVEGAAGPSLRDVE
ncbi:MAG: exodeoxyribonuclease VII small subunit [Roseomonas sp.]|nr:exodeoxyribonuclease VII small subunit [Roseomonas sp.]MCA3326155.1 exodeoxyribonuclease VII small subunit [Roseomonas sp.]MCA3330261.1 exodeoxyribonuclease VII small subunit [Roseomonas sp.]MCA3335289.1 exodeoxyribonuclease VII small subunit [Roseomonas sp.]MCA3348666.1 exodeoxyribonuclease VII small subunit [Roseomonas sp.]